MRSLVKKRLFAEFCVSLASLAECKRGQVAALICDQQFCSILAIGYNGQPSGIEHTCCTGESGNCGCIHAEANALLKLRTETKGHILMCTKSPCRHCAGLIINSKQVTEVYYGKEHRDDGGIVLLRKAGLICEFYGNLV